MAAISAARTAEVGASYRVRKASFANWAPTPYIGPMAKDDYIIRPDPLDPRLTERVTGIDQTGARIETAVTVERALTIFLNSQEIVTAMTISDHPEYLALGYLLNQNMLKPDDVVTDIDYDDE